MFEGAKKDKVWAVCNSGGNVGIAIMNVLGGVIATYYGWRYLFIIPAIISMLIAFIILKVEDNSPKKEVGKQSHI